MPTRLDMAAHMLVALFLASVLAVPGASTPVAALACIVTLAAGWNRWRQDARDGFRHMSVLVVPAAAYLVLLTLQMAAGAAPLSLASHILIGLLTLGAALSGVPNRIPDVRRWLLPAAAVGALGTCALALYQVHVLGYPRPYGWLGGGPLGSGAIKFGDLAALQALLSLVLVLSAATVGARVLGLAGLFSGMLALALTQTRGGILGFVLAVAALVVALALRRRRERARPIGAALAGDGSRARRARTRRGTAALMVAFALVLSMFAAAFMQERFAQIEPQVQRYLRGDVDSEVGQRLLLWQAAVRAGLHAPLTGVGFGRFSDELDRQVRAGDIAGSDKLLYRQAHSEYLAAFAHGGVPGLLALLMMYLAPAYRLIRQIGAGAGSPAAWAALVCTTAFAGFALTDDMFDRQITVVTFFLLNAWLLRAAWPAGAVTGMPRSA